MFGFVNKLLPRRYELVKAGSSDVPQPDPQIGRHLLAKFEGVQTTPENEVHWKKADQLSPNAAASRSARLTAAHRARHEYKNDCYVKGIVTTIANDTIGRRPRLQMMTADHASNRQLEKDFNSWATETRFPMKLRTMVCAKRVDGESLGRLITNRRLKLVKLDLRIYETEQLSDPIYNIVDRGYDEDFQVDGVRLDGKGNPVRYHFLKRHPGGQFGSRFDVLPTQGEWVDSEKIVHLFRRDRAEQQRGMSELQPALELFPMRRRYALASVAAAETAADFAGIVKTTSSAYGAADTVAKVDPGLQFPVRRRTLVSLPFGWELQQLRAEQPTASYKDFHKEIIREIARCLNIPYNVAAGDSAESNYASGRLDHQSYFRALDIDRSEIEDYVLEKVFGAWLNEYLAIKSGIRQEDIDLSQYPHRWSWDPHPHVDPEKEAKGLILLWDKGLLTDEDFFSRESKDPEKHYEELGEMVERRRELGLPLPGIAMQEISTDEQGNETQSQSSA